MKAAYLLIGGNLGDRLSFLDGAKEKMKQKGIQILRTSSVYETAAWGNTDQSSFLNQVLEVSTALSPTDLMTELLAIELSLGRKRIEKNGTRTIDIDILYYEKEMINTAGLTIPHERIALRKFVLIPLAELIPDFIDPRTGKSVAQLLEECPDSLPVNPYEKN